jgi:hypothetical protein
MESFRYNKRSRAGAANTIPDHFTTPCEGAMQQNDTVVIPKFKNPELIQFVNPKVYFKKRTGFTVKAPRGLFKCHCGKVFETRCTNKGVSESSSCGCIVKLNGTTHGMYHTRTYRAWAGMHRRCRDNKGKSRKWYFEKGIRVCERWKLFENFLADMGEVPVGLWLDRIDGNKGYEPSNCRWADLKTQSRNKSDNRFLSIDGESKTLVEWSELSGVNCKTIASRLRLGWPEKKAVFEKAKPRFPIQMMGTTR